MLIGTQLIGFGAGGAAAPVSLAFCGAATATANLTATISSHPIGTAAASRYVVVCVGAASGNTITSVTVDGIATSQVVGTALAGVFPGSILVTNAPIPSGTTASIVVTLSGAASIRCVTYALYDPQSTTPHDTKSTTTDNTALNISVPAGGVCLGFGFGPNGSSITVTNGSVDNSNIVTVSMTAAHTTTIGTVGLTFDSSGTLYGAMAASFL